MDQRALIPTETLVDDRTDLQTGNEVRLAPDGSGFQVAGPGMLDTVMVRATKPDYRLTAETGATQLIDEDFTTLRTISSDLKHISAYDDDGDHITVLENYPYQERSMVTITPLEDMTFERIRGVWILGLPVGGF